MERASSCLLSLCRSAARRRPAAKCGPAFAALRKSVPARGFITPPWESAVQTISASRTLPHRTDDLYALIADVGSYSSFLPYCQSSTITQWSQPDTNGKRWPSRAQLNVGWGGVEAAFSSKIYCLPGRVVEAIGGDAETTLDLNDLPHHIPAGRASDTANDTMFKYLLTRWEVSPARQPSASAGHANTLANEKTEVNLVVEFQFTNPLYDMMSKAATPKVASMMIEAFEQRAAKLLTR
ncbi:hypothetical protein L228DRAFT_246110 [Xylona heveae TC161]|uniref:Coenzyme Q-binding protein COQ10 START domain-containing protein n=1 Tax=Xylona heveae (strain CBS 132557 / TC161) TaxID=1328760 RepID=A0A165HDJ8_XYLHT|nr:hypothetical protein L228DRAFT_246110 [Xylona heveae TC161]KZF23345.1 hypothetical protein L228DRAFT_246110 [Xylona heveae TC161]